MTANIYYILRYIHYKLYICNNSTSFSPFVLKRCVGQCFFSPVGQIYIQSPSALLWSRWRHRWCLPHGHRTSAGKTTHSRFNKAQHAGSSSSTILSRAPADRKSTRCCSWRQEDLPVWMPVMNLHTPFLRLLWLQSLGWLHRSDGFPRTKIWIKALLSSCLETAGLNLHVGRLDDVFRSTKASQVFLTSANIGWLSQDQAPSS